MKEILLFKIKKNGNQFLINTLNFCKNSVLLVFFCVCCLICSQSIYGQTITTGANPSNIVKNGSFEGFQIFLTNITGSTTYHDSYIEITIPDNWEVGSLTRTDPNDQDGDYELTLQSPNVYRSKVFELPYGTGVGVATFRLTARPLCNAVNNEIISCSYYNSNHIPIVSTSTNPISITNLDVFDLSNITSTGSYLDGLKENVNFSGQIINNTSDDISSGLIRIYFDSNNDGNPDALAQGSTAINLDNIPSYGTTFSQSSPIELNEVCDLILMMTTVDNTRLCNNISAIVPSPGYSLQTPEEAVCHGTGLTIGDPQTGSYSYLWSFGLNSPINYLTQIDIPQPVFKNEDVISDQEIRTYNLQITRDAGCTANTYIEITENLVPELENPLTDAICSGEAFTYTAESSIGNDNTVFQWVRPAVPEIDIPGSGNSENINEILINDSDNTVDIKYEFILTSTLQGACSTNVEAINLSVNPAPRILSSLDHDNICSGSYYDYQIISSLGPSYTSYEWRRPAYPFIVEDAVHGNMEFISDRLTNKTNEDVDVEYEITVMSSLQGNCIKTETFIVTVFPEPKLTGNLDYEICSGEDFNYTGVSSLDHTTTEFSWSRASITGINEMPKTENSNIISEILTNNTAIPIDVEYIFTLTSGIPEVCTNDDTVTVTVNPKPILTSPGSVQLCSGDTFNYNAVSSLGNLNTDFAWIREDENGIDENANSGNSSNISEILTNSTSLPIDVKYIFTLTSNIYGNCINNDTVIVTVNPKPELISADSDIICSGSMFNYTAISSLGDSNTSFLWTRPSVSGIIEGATSGNTATINEELTNNTNAPVDVEYVFTMTSLLQGSCVANKIITVTVNPASVLTSSTTSTICSGNVLNYNAVSSIGNINTTFEWERPYVSGIEEPASNGNSETINETLTNNTDAPLEIIYIFTLTSTLDGNCITKDTLFVNVNPGPVLISPLEAIHCSGSVFDYIAISSLGDTYTDFNWTRSSVGGITEAGSSGNTSQISEILTNTTTSSVDVEYIFSLTSNLAGNCTHIDTLAVTVALNPELTSDLNDIACSGKVFNYTAESSFGEADTDFTWSRAYVTGINEPSNNGTTSDISEVLTNLTTQSIDVEYEFILTSTLPGACEKTEIVTVTVEPVLEFNLTESDYSICHGNNNLQLLFTSSNDPSNSFNYNYVIEGLPSGFSNLSGTLPDPDDVINIGISSSVPAGDYTGNIKVSVDGESGNCIIQKNFTITINPNTEFAFANADSKFGVCFGEESVKLEYNSGNIFGSIDYRYKIEFSNHAIMAGFTDIPYSILPADSDGIEINLQRYIFPGSYSGVIHVNLISDPLCNPISLPFTIIIAPQPLISSVYDVVYYNGEITDPIYIESNIQDDELSIIWRNTSLFTSIPIEINGLANYGIGNMIPSFTAQTNNNETISVDYDIIMSFTYEGITCEDYKIFNITIEPSVDFTLNNTSYAVCKDGITNNLNLDYSTNNSSLDYNYEITFSPQSLNAGFVNDSGILPPSSDGIDLDISGISSGIYLGNITVTLSGSHEAHSVSYDFEIIINDQPELNFINDVEYCHGQTVPSLNFSGNISSAQFFWENTSSTQTVISGLPFSDSSQMPSFIANNTTGNSIVAEYTVTMSHTNSGVTCSDSKSFDITIRPLVTINNIEDQIICNGEDLIINFSGQGATGFNWEKISGNSIPGLDNYGSGNINTTLSNSTSQVLNATYRVTPTSGICEQSSQEFDISVYPTPSLTSSIQTTIICSGDRFTYVATSNVSGVEFSWVSMDYSETILSRGNSQYIDEILFNNTPNPLTITYEILLNQNNGCITTEEVKVIVNPVPQINFNYLNYACWNANEIEIPYTSENSLSYQYTVTFEASALDAGFSNITSNLQLPAGNLPVTLPEIKIPGVYHATLNIYNSSCIDSHQIAIIINDPITITEQPQSINEACNNEFDIDLWVMATGNDLTYQWYHNETLIPGAIQNNYVSAYAKGLEGEYYVIVGNDCEEIKSHVITVKANNVTVGLKWDDVLYVDNSENLFVAYQWFKNGNAITNNGNMQYFTDFNGLEGSYHVVCYYADNTFSESCPRTFDSQESSTLSIYPNPVIVGSRFTIEVDNSDGIENSTAEIYDALGRLISKHKICDYKTEIQSPEHTGSYLIKIVTSSGNKVSNKHLIVK